MKSWVLVEEQWLISLKLILPRDKKLLLATIWLRVNLIKSQLKNFISSNFILGLFQILAPIIRFKSFIFTDFFSIEFFRNILKMNFLLDHYFLLFLYPWSKSLGNFHQQECSKLGRNLGENKYLYYVESQK